ncbi:hypothetical protein Tco_0979174 [Tanacetum coccineum]
MGRCGGAVVVWQRLVVDLWWYKGCGGGYDVDEGGVSGDVRKVMVMTWGGVEWRWRRGGCGAAGDAAQQQGGGVEASGLVDRVDRVRRNIIGLGRKTLQKIFLVAGGGGRRSGGGWPDNMGERERVNYECGLKV